jgi:glyoxylase-like metal-dependent hydrolase (beta-lactamase superfamily II)
MGLLMPLRLGRFEVHEVRDGTFALDGGAMFGVVPKALWSKKHIPDDRNRIQLALRCLLICDGHRRVLVDDGIGTQWDDKHLEMYGIDRSRYHLDLELERAGCTRDAITDVVLTHLHFDHAGGTTRRENGKPVLSFPRATYHIQRRQWNWAHHPSEKDAGSFRMENLGLMESSGRLHLLEGHTELFRGIEVFPSEGHTVGLQVIRLNDDGQSLVYCSDVIPTTSHFRPAWVMAYDLYPLAVMEEKKMILAQAVEEGSILVFEHDPQIAACTVKEHQEQVIVDQVIAL